MDGPYVFLSYNSRDRSAVAEVAKQLGENGIRVFFDQRSLQGGDNWQVRIGNAIAKETTCCAVFWGPNGAGPYHKREVEVANVRDAQDPEYRVIPVLLAGAEPPSLETFLGLFHRNTTVSLAEDDALAFRELCRKIRQAHAVAPATELTDAIPNPYKGLLAFEDTDAWAFFGREADVDQCLDRLRDSRLLTIIGASGSGKSSLARAGIVPALRDGNEIPGSESWPIVLCTPGLNPVEELYRQLFSLKDSRVDMRRAMEEAAAISLPEAANSEPKVESMLHGKKFLHYVTHFALHDMPSCSRFVLLVDQFEEMFTSGVDEVNRVRAIENLLYAASVSDGKTIVILTMRSDLYGRVTDLPKLLRDPIVNQQYPLGPMSVEQLTAAIQQPAQEQDVGLEQELVTSILRDAVGQAGFLPHLQVVLKAIWSERDGRTLTAKSYLAAGGIEGALSRQCERIYTEDLSEADREKCRNLFFYLIKAVTHNENTDGGNRGESTSAEIYASWRSTDRQVDRGSDPDRVVGRAPTVCGSGA